MGSGSKFGQTAGQPQFGSQKYAPTNSFGASSKPNFMQPKEDDNLQLRNTISENSNPLPSTFVKSGGPSAVVKKVTNEERNWMSGIQ